MRVGGSNCSSLAGIKTGKPSTIAVCYTALVILWLLPVRGGCVTSNYTAVGVTTLIWDMWSRLFEIFIQTLLDALFGGKVGISKPSPYGPTVAFLRDPRLPRTGMNRKTAVVAWADAGLA